MNPRVQTVCAACGNPPATVCANCNSDANSRYYCSKLCQENDWPKHRKACKDAQNLYLENALERIAEIVKRAYYDFRKNTWHMSTVAVLVGKSFLEIYNGNFMEKTSYFAKFSVYLAPDEQTEHAMLFAICCREPLAWMQALIAALLKDLNVEIEKITVRLHSVRRAVVFHGPSPPPMTNWPNSFHELLRVKSTKTKKQWVLDVTREQYGISRALWAWDEYEKNHLVHLLAVHPFVWNAAVAKAASREPGHVGLWLNIGGIETVHLSSAIKTWTDARRLNPAKIITLEEGEYGEAKDGLLKAMDDAVRSFVAENGFQVEYQAAKFYEMFPGGSTRAIFSVFGAFSGDFCSLST